MHLSIWQIGRASCRISSHEPFRCGDFCLKEKTSREKEVGNPGGAPLIRYGDGKLAEKLRSIPRLNKHIPYHQVYL
jgi:hypothetical protein